MLIQHKKYITSFGNQSIGHKNTWLSNLLHTQKNNVLQLKYEQPASGVSFRINKYAEYDDVINDAHFVLLPCIVATVLQVKYCTWRFFWPLLITENIHLT